VAGMQTSYGFTVAFHPRQKREHETTGAAPHQIRALSHHDNPVRYTRRRHAASTAGIAPKPCHLFATRGARSYGKVSGLILFFTVPRLGYYSGEDGFYA
jgi:hypothetical protein